MAIFSDWELSNREAAGYEAMGDGKWRLAYDCFNDCAEYLKRTRAWDTTAIEKYERLARQCNANF